MACCSGNACTPGVKLHDTTRLVQGWCFSAVRNWEGWLHFCRMTQVFLPPLTALAGAAALSCTDEETSVPLQIPAPEGKAIPFFVKHHHCCCEPPPLGSHPSPGGDRAAPWEESRSPVGARPHFPLPGWLASCSPLSPQYLCIAEGR